MAITDNLNTDVAPAGVGSLGMTEMELNELTLAMIVELKMFVVAFIALWLIFKVVRWRK